MSIVTYTKNNTTRVNTSPGGSNNSPACAVCKYQRRRCAPDCLLAPYFPADHQKDFLNAHRLFGVSNITKILKSVKPFERETAMKSMIFQANVRASDPVGGCYRMIDELQQQIDYYKAELDLVLHQLVFYHAQSMKNGMQNLHENGSMSIDALSVSNPSYTQGIQPIQLKEQGFFSQDSNQIICSSDQVVPTKIDMMEFLHDIEPLADDQSTDTKPLLGMYDERQRYAFESKKSVRFSDKVVLKNGTSSSESKQENELKNTTSSCSLKKSSSLRP